MGLILTQVDYFNLVMIIALYLYQSKDEFNGQKLILKVHKSSAHKCQHILDYCRKLILLK